MSIKLPTEQHLEFLSLKGGCAGSPESTLVKIPHCWKSHVGAQFFWTLIWIQSADLFDILMVFLKELFKIINFEKNEQRQ